MASIQIDWHCVCGDGPSSHYTHEDGERCYGWCQGTDHDCSGLGYRPINHTRRPAPFVAMLKAIGEDSERWPIHYRVDLSTDYQMILKEIDEGDRFIWIVRESGTHLYPLKYIPTDDHGFIRQAMQYHERNTPTAHVFIWDGWSKLERVTFEKARDVVREVTSHPSLASVKPLLPDGPPPSPNPDCQGVNEYHMPGEVRLWDDGERMIALCKSCWVYYNTVEASEGRPMRGWLEAQVYQDHDYEQRLAIARRMGSES